MSSTFESSRQTQGYVVRLDDVERRTAPVRESVIIYTARSKEAHTRLRACTVSVSGGALSLYVTGGTTGNLFAQPERPGQASELVVVHLDVNGNLRRGVQTPAKRGSTFGAAVEASPQEQSPELLVAAQIDDDAAMTSTIALHRLRPETLTQTEEPAVLSSFGYIQPRSIAASPKFTAATNTSVVFIAGSARIAADKKNDIVCDVHSKYGKEREALNVYRTSALLSRRAPASWVSRVPQSSDRPTPPPPLRHRTTRRVSVCPLRVQVTVDGARNGKLNDYGVAVKGGSDGNAYVAGYSMRFETSASTGLAGLVEVPVLTVVSPTGKTLLTYEMSLSGRTAQKVSDMELVESPGEPRTVLFIGQSRPRDDPAGATNVSIRRVQILPDAVPAFEGFGSVVESAGAANTSNAGGPKRKAGSTSVPMLPIIGGALGGLAVIVAAVAYFVIQAMPPAVGEVEGEYVAPPAAPAQMA
jgi:hypothetical protein